MVYIEKWRIIYHYNNIMKQLFLSYLRNFIVSHIDVYNKEIRQRHISCCSYDIKYVQDIHVQYNPGHSSSSFYMNHGIRNHSYLPHWVKRQFFKGYDDKYVLYYSKNNSSYKKELLWGWNKIMDKKGFE
jgi:hypothetical protein